MAANRISWPLTTCRCIQSHLASQELGVSHLFSTFALKGLFISRQIIKNTQHHNDQSPTTHLSTQIPPAQEQARLRTAQSCRTSCSQPAAKSYAPKISNQETLGSHVLGNESIFLARPWSSTLSRREAVAPLSSCVSGNTSHFSPLNRMEVVGLPYIDFIIWDTFLPCLVSPEFVITNGTGFLTEVIKCPFLQMTWLSIKDPRDSIRKPLELTNMWSKVAGYNISMPGPISFLYSKDSLRKKPW